jgi:alpha-tubulin suppressor-like RCC1 family protein
MSRPFSLLIATKPVWVTNPTLDVALKGATLTRILSAHDAVSYALHTGTLPNGVVVTTSGELSGTPAEDGSFVFTVRATGESANASTDRTFTILVAAQPAWTSPQELPALPVATSVTYQLVADGGTSFSLQSGSLPGGLTLSPLGLLSGTPGLVGSYAFVVRAVSTHPDFVTDRSFTLQVNEPPTWVTAAALADVATGTAVSLQFEASLSPSYSVLTGTVPVGTTLSPQGVLSGTPTDPGVYTFSIRASNAPGYGTNRTFTILVVAAPVWVTTSPLADVFADTPLSLQFVATGATGFSLVGTLPAGVTLASNGLLSGTPTATGTTNFQVRALTASASVSALETFVILVTKQPVFTTATALPSSFKTAAAATVIAATDAVSYELSSGTLPTGTTLSTAGILSGTFDEPGSFAFDVKANGTSSIAFANKSFTQLVVTPPVWQTLPSLTELLRDRPATFQLDATYASEYSLEYGVVPGISVSTSGLLSGTPTVAGTTPITIRAKTPNPGVYTDREFSALVELTPVWVTATAVTTAAQGFAYTFTFVTDTGVNYTLKSGSFPLGLTLSSAGVLSGTTTDVGSYSFEIRAAKASPTNYTDKAFTLDVTDVPVWATAAALTDVASTLAYSVTLSASNTDLYTVTTGALPTGLTLTGATGVIAGTPSANGTFNFTIRARRTGTTTVFTDRAFTQVVALKPVWTTGASLVATAQNIAYSLSLVATNTASYAVTAGALPPGVTLASNGALSGTPTAIGTYVFTVTATSTGSSIITTDRAFTLETVPLPVWTTTTLLDVPTNVGISVPLVAVSGVSYAVKSGTLPTGLTLSSGGLLSGTPTAAGSFSFVVTATGAATNATTDQALTQLVATTPTWSTGASLSNTAQNVVYSQTLVATNANATGYSVTAGSLPAGVSLSTAGVLSGTPTALATYNFTVRANSTTSILVFAEREFTLTTVPLPVWTTTTLTDVPTAAGYSVQLVATNAMSFALKTGTLPTGLSLSAGGLLTGTPSATGSFSFTITATGNATNALTDQALTQVVATTPTWTTGASLANTAQSVAYSFALLASNASATGFSVTTGALPPGVSLATDGTLSGTPTASATYNFTVRALSTLSTSIFADRAFTLITVPLPVWTTTTLTDVPTSSVYSVQLVAANAISFALETGALPTGLSLSAGGLLTGTPSAAGSFAFTITATGNAINAVTDQALTQIVATTPTWTTGASLASTAQDVAYSFALLASNASTTGYSVLSGTLPPGVTLATDGTLSGTPSSVGTYNFTVRVRSVLSAIVFADRAFSLTTVPLPVWSSPAAGSLVDLPTGTAITTINFVATNGLTYAVQTGTLPTGLALSTGGQLTGTPTAAGSFSFTVRATGNATNATNDRSFTQLVASVPVWTTSASLTDIAATTAVSFQFVATNAVSYALTAGSLPPGLSLSSGGLLTGTADSTIATYNFTIRATGSSAVAFADLAFTQNVVANITLNYIRYRGVKKLTQDRSLFMGSDGRLYGCGINGVGQLTGTVGSATEPMTQLPTLVNMAAMAPIGVGNQNYAKDAAGQWYVWGPYAAGSLGTGSTSAGSTVPIAWNGLANVARMEVDGGGGSSGTNVYALTTSGAWYYWGNNTDSVALGTGSSAMVPTPTLLTALTNVKDIVATGGGFLALLENGNLHGTGITVNSTVFTWQPIMTGVSKIYGGCRGSAYIVAKTDGSIWGWGVNYSGMLTTGNTTSVPYTAPVRLTNMEALGTIRDIAISNQFILVLLASGVVKAFGLVAHWRNGTGDSLAGETVAGLPSIAYVFTGTNHSVFVTSGLQIYTSGSNASWQCGFNTGNPRDPTLLTTTFTLAPIAVTPTWNTPTAFTVSGAFAKRLDASDAGTYYLQSGALPGGVTLSTDGLLSGSLASDTTASFTIRAYGATTTAYSDRVFTLTGTAAGIKKIESSETYTLTLTTDGSVYAVGYALAGSGNTLGNGSGALSYAVPTKISGLSGIVDIATINGNVNCALDSTGAVYSWGINDSGLSTGTNTAAGTNILTPTLVTAISGITALFGGSGHIYATKADGSIYAIGNAWFAVRQPAPALIATIPGVKKVTGQGFTAVLTESGNTYTMYVDPVYSVGRANILGTGKTSGDLTVPTLLSTGIADIAANGGFVQLTKSGDVLMNMGVTAYTTPTLIPEASGKGVTALFAANSKAIMFMTATGALFTAFNILSDNGTTVAAIGNFVPMASPVPMVKVLTASAGKYCQHMQGTDGKVYAWGQNKWATSANSTIYSAATDVPIFSNLLQAGTFNSATTINRSFVTTGDALSLFVGTDGNVYGAGDNSGGELTGVGGSATNTVIQVPGLSNIVRLSEGISRRPNFAKDKAGNWWAWGRINNGSLGNGSTTSSVQAPTAWNFVANTERIVSADLAVFAKTTDNRWFRWGSNSLGELGLGNTTSTGTPTEFTALSNIANVYANGSGMFYVHLRDGSLYGMGQYARTSTVSQGTADVTAPTFITNGVAVVYAANSTCSIIRKSDGTIWCWGFNTGGQLGLGNTTAVYADAMVRNTSLEAFSIRSISTNGNAVLVLLNDGTVYATGNRAAFQNATGNYTTPTLLSGLAGIKYADVDTSATFVNSSNQVYTSGGNVQFQTGFNSGNPRDPTLLSTSFTLAAYSSEDVPIWLTSADLSGAALNAVFSKQLTATFGYSFNLVSGSLPTGLTLTSAGVLSGTPTAAGSYGFTVRAFGGSTAAYADKTFAMDFASSSVPDTEFESLKTAGNIANVANVYEVGAYSFLPVAGMYDFVVLGQTSTTTLATRMTCSLFTLGTYNQYEALPRDAALNGATMPGSSTTTVTANTNYYVRYTFTTNTLTAVLCTGFTPATWTFSGVVSTTSWAIAADMGDVSLEALKFSTSGVGTLSGVWSRNTPVLALSGYQRGLKGAHGFNLVMTSTGDVYGAGTNSSGQITGTVGAAANTMTKVPALANMTHFGEGISADLTFAKDAYGTWWSWGSRQAYERGDGASGTATGLVPAPFTALSNINRIVSATQQGKFALTADGTWYVWGSNNTGVLGNGTTTAVATPTKFAALSGIADIFGWESASGSCALFLLNDGKLYGAGDFGDGFGVRSTPTLISAGVKKVVGGQFALKTDGTWICFGANESGSLGIGNTTPVLITAPVSNTFLNAAPIRYLTSWRLITVLVRTSGQAFGVGNRTYYANDATSTSSFESIPILPTSGFAVANMDGDNCASYFMTWDRKLYTAGLNGASQTGFVASTRVAAALLSTTFTLAPLSRAPTWNTAATILAVSAGGVVSLRLDATDARLYKVVSGALPAGLTLSTDGLISGMATTANAYAFTVRAYGMTSGSIADRSFSWTVDGQSIDGTFEAYKTAGTIAKVSNAYNLGAYSFLPTSGTYDFVATDRVTTTAPGAAFAVSMFTGGTSSSGAYSTYAVSSSGATKDAVAMTASSTSGSAAVTANVDYYARLRIEATQMTYTLHSSFTPGTWTFGAPVLTQTYAVSASDVSLENMQVTTSGVGTLQNIYSVNTPIVAATEGSRTSNGPANANMYLSVSGDMYACGNNANGRFNGVVGSASNLLTKMAAPTNVVRFQRGAVNNFSFAQDTAGTWWSWGSPGPNERGDGTATAGLQTPTAFTSVPNMTRVLCAGDSFYAKSANGKWWRWGNNSSGTCCTGNTTAMPTPTEFIALTGIKDVTTGGAWVCFLLEDGSLYGAGNFQEGAGNRTSPVLLLSSVARLVGNGYACHALKTDGTWWSFGANSDGRLGVGTTSPVLATAAVSNPMLNAFPVRSITCGGSATIVVRANGVIIASGNSSEYKGVAGSNSSSGEVLTGLPTNVSNVVYPQNTSVSWTTYDGKLYTAGVNDSSQAAVATPNPKPIGLITPPFTLAPIARAPTWNTAATLPAFATGTAASVRLDATDARLYKVVSGALPTGLSLSVDGLLSGTPTVAGSFGFTVRAFGMTSGAYADRTFTMTDYIFDWTSRVTAAGGTVSAGQVTAATTLVTTLANAGIMSKMSRMNLMCGDQLTASLVPLVNTVGAAKDTSFNFAAGDYTVAGGLQGNGTNKYVDMGVDLSKVSKDGTNMHLSVTALSTPNNTLIGNYDGNAGYMWYTPTTMFWGGSVAFTAITSATHVVMTRLSGAATLYSAGASYATIASPNGTTPAPYLTLFKYDGGNFSNSKIGAYSVGTGLSAGEVTTYRNAMTAFNAALSRPAV